MSSSMNLTLACFLFTGVGINTHVQPEPENMRSMVNSVFAVLCSYKSDMQFFAFAFKRKKVNL